MREASPFSDKQAIQKRKEKKNQNQHSGRARNLFRDNHQEKWLLQFPCEHETLNFLGELTFADGRFLVHGNQVKCGKFLSPLTFLLYNN